MWQLVLDGVTGTAGGCAVALAVLLIRRSGSIAVRTWHMDEREPEHDERRAA